MTPALSADRLSKSFSGFKALTDVSLAVMPGAIQAVIGPNGAGKTTLFDVLTGLHRPDGGRVLLGDADISALGPSRRARQGIARSFQRSSVFAGLSLTDNVRAAIVAREGQAWSVLRPLGRRHVDEAAALLSDVGLAGRGAELSGALAHGDRRQLELAVALAQRPAILLLDEPMAGMAPAETRRCAALVERLARDRGLALLFTEHDMEVVFGMADRVAVLHHGTLIAEGTPSEVRSDQRVRDVYLGRGG